jgi:outer membrane autotransporter protein
VVRPGQKFGPPFSGEPTGEQNCRQTSRQDYAGFQIGTDIGKLNIGNSGGNLHFGVTASFFDAWSRDTTPSSDFEPMGDVRSHFQVPSLGLYTAFTQGNFFADAQVRWDFYQSTSSSVTSDFHGVQDDARGIAVTTSAGYKIPLMSNWFIEPSLGGSWSRLEVDPVRLVDRDGNGGFVRVEDIDSILGRASLRVGTTITQGIYTWQPFVTASAIHEFAAKVTSTSTLVDSCACFNGIIFDTSTDRFGTYGQFGLGTAIVVGNTGWLGYGRADIKVGENLSGAGFNVGLRYQW